MAVERTCCQHPPRQVERPQAAPRGGAVQHVVVKQGRHMDELRDLR